MPEAECLCGHPKRAHRSKVYGGRVVAFCERCEACSGFGIIDPDPPRALLMLDDDGNVEPQGAATLDEVVTVLAGRSRIPLSAYDAWACLTCGSRRFEPSACCGRPMVAVRVEIHAREVP
jgi:hypothetical protein